MASVRPTYSLGGPSSGVSYESSLSYPTQRYVTETVTASQDLSSALYRSVVIVAP